MTSPAPSTDDILAMYALDSRQDAQALERYLVRYPLHARALIAFSHELELQQNLAGDRPIDAASEAWIEQASDRAVSTRDPFAVLDAQRYGALREALGVPSLILNAFRDRLVVAGTVPLRFLDRLADNLGTSLTELVDFLARPPGLQPSAQHKSDGVPSAPAKKASFATLLDEAGVPSERAAELLADD